MQCPKLENTDFKSWIGLWLVGWLEWLPNSFPLAHFIMENKIKKWHCMKNYKEKKILLLGLNY